MKTQDSKQSSNLVEYETIVDTDLAVFAMCMKIFSKDSLRPEITSAKRSLSSIKNILLFRTERNPLSVLLVDKYKDSYDVLLDEMVKEFPEELNHYERFNDIFEYIYLMETNNDRIENTIICKNEYQKKKVREMIPDIKIIDYDENGIDMDPYGCLFIKYSKDLFNYKNLSNKYLYIYNARFNLTEGYTIDDVTMLLAKTNHIRTIDPYKNLRVPNAGGNNL